MSRLIKISVLCIIFSMCMCTLVIANEIYQLRKAIMANSAVQITYDNDINITIDNSINDNSTNIEQNNYYNK